MARWTRWIGAAVLAVAMVAAGTAPAAAGQGAGRAHDYLALGDSVPFGFNPNADPHHADNFVGYPELTAPDLGLALTNATCPGEASGGFISLTGTDNVCRPYRSAFPLHAAYTGSQLDFALSFLSSHPRAKLVSITLGANDLFVCQKTTVDGCAAPTELAAALATYRANLTTILARVRQIYHHELVALTYYSTDYRDAQTTGAIAAVNAVTASVVSRFDGEVADGFTAFAVAAAPAGGDSCAAGLLIRTSATTCDIHPSPTGARLLAGTLERAAG
jgi:lysophospholipase L1-like esterase